MSSLQEQTPTQDDPLVGQIFEGRFKILSVLGKGGVGVVYQARHTHMDKLVAIKMLLGSVVSDAESFLRFEQEARAASSLTHRNIITIHDFGKSTDGHAYLVMEYLDGTSLDCILANRGRLSPGEFMYLFKQVCQGMQYAHNKGIVHRDIKTSNLMLVDTDEVKGVIKIVDFGLAKLTNSESAQHLTTTGVIMGSPQFMSPEQCLSLPLDHRSDIYSLGCVMYKAISGRVPFLGENVLATLYKHLHEKPAPFAPDLAIPPALEQAIMKSLEKDMANRQRSMAELGKDIEDAIMLSDSPLSGFSSAGQPLPSAAMPPLKGSSQSPQALAGKSHTVSPGSATAPDIMTGRDGQARANSERPAGARIGGAAIFNAKPSATVGKNASSFAVGGFQNNKKPIAFWALIGTAAAALAATAGWHHGNFTNITVQTAATNRPTPVNMPVTPLKPLAQKAAVSTQQAPLAPVRTQTKIKQSKLHGQPAIGSATPINIAEPFVGPNKRTGAENSKQKAEDKRKKLESAESFRKLANEAANNRNWLDAQNNFERCLQLELQVYKSDDPHLVVTMARILACLRDRTDLSKMQVYLDPALTICGLHEQQVAEIVNQTEDPILIWRPLAFISLDAAKASDRQGQPSLSYYRWATYFYKQALNSYKGGNKITEPVYRKLTENYRQALVGAGDTATAQELNNELQSTPNTGNNFGKGMRMRQFKPGGFRWSRN